MALHADLRKLLSEHREVTDFRGDSMGCTCGGSGSFGHTEHLIDVLEDFIGERFE